MFLMNNPPPKLKKTVKWNETVQRYETFSKEEYDRSIDNETIQINIKNRVNRRLIRIPTNNYNQNALNPFSLFSKFKGPQVPSSYGNLIDSEEYSNISPYKSYTVQGAPSMLVEEPFGIELPKIYKINNSPWKNVFDMDETPIPFSRRHSEIFNETVPIEGRLPQFGTIQYTEYK
jgi:hypothetical protein